MVMANIYTNCGEYNKALDELAYLSSMETGFTVNYFKFDKWIQPLLEHPRYKELEKKYAI